MTGGAESDASSGAFTQLAREAFVELDAEAVECAGPAGGNTNLCGMSTLDTDALLAALDDSEALAALEPTDEWHEDHGMYLRSYTWGETQVRMIHNPAHPTYNVQIVAIGLSD
jgi:hypothetical protein